MSVYRAGIDHNYTVSEQLIGKAMKKYSIPREKVVLLTKCYGTVGEEPAMVSGPSHSEQNS